MDENRIKLLLNNLEILPGNNTQFGILLTCLRTLQKILNKKNIRDLLKIDIEILNTLRNISNDDIDFIGQNISPTNLTIKECQVIVQKNIPKMKRKKLAAYYTNDQGLKLMQALVADYDRRFKQKTYTICDPFLGSARTLSAVIDKMGTEKFDFVWGIEPDFLSALVAFTSLLVSVKGDVSKLSVIHGDAFQYIPEFIQKKNERYNKVDFILTNPPFTRWENISDKMKQKLPNLIKQLGFGKYLDRIDTGLQTYSMFLCEKLLKVSGLIVAVLPSSTFYTIGCRGYKRLLKEKNDILALIESKREAAFSIDSGFKEVILVSQREKKEGRKTVFAQLNTNYKELSYSIIYQEKYEEGKYYDLEDIPEFLDNNWLALLPNENKIRESIIEILIRGMETKQFINGESLIGKEKIVRGVEMYGPDFFFIPNKYWNIKEISDSGVIIQKNDANDEIVLRKEYLIKALRKPNLYRRKIEVELESFALSVPEKNFSELTDDIKEYIQWGIDSGTPNPAMKSFGKYWYSHIYKSISTKQPFGHVFMSDKIDLKFANRSVFANFSSKKVSASKNFYLIKDIERETAEFLCAWLNSTFFISIFIFFGRKISDTWTRLLIDDYLKLPILNYERINKELFEEVLKVFRKMKTKELPSIGQQLNKGLRVELDSVFARVLGINKAEEFVRLMHDSLDKYLQSLK